MNLIISALYVSHCIPHAYAHTQIGVKEPIVSACQNSKRLNYNHLSPDGSGFLSSTHVLLHMHVGTWYL